MMTDIPSMPARLTRLSERTSRMLIVLGLCVFFGALSGQYLAKIRHGSNRSAFLRWSNQIHDLRQGDNIWDKHNYPNPPIMALILVPFTLLPPVLGAMAWFLCKVGMAIAALRWVWGMVEASEPLPLTGKLISLALVLRPIEGDLVHGNVNLFILFLVTAALVAFTRRRDLLSGLLLGLAIACKVTPALFLPYLAWKRAWRCLIGSAVGLVLFLGVVPGAFLGFEENAEYLGTWAQNMVLPYVAENVVTSEHQNQSLPGLLHRLLTHSPSYSQRTETEYIPLEYHNWLDLDPALVQGFVKVLLCGYLLLLARTCRTPAGERTSWRLVAEFALVMLGMLLFSERTWKHHCVTLLFPAAVLGLVLSRPGLASARSRRLGWTCVILAVLFMLSTSALVPALDRFGDLAQVYGAYVWAFLLLVVPLVHVLKNKPIPQPEIEIFQARISCTTEPDTSGSGLPMRSCTSVSGSMPSR